MLRSISIFVVMAICLALPSMGRADEHDPAEHVYQRTLNVLRQQYAELHASLQIQQKKLIDIEMEIQGETGLVDVDPQTVHRLITTLEEQREQMELEAAGADGRRAALEEAIAKLSKQLDERTASDQVSIELAKLVDIRVTELKRATELHGTGVTPQSDVESAQAALATARAELAAARQKAISSASAEALDTWNRQLVELTIAAQERAARLKFVNERLAKFSGIMQGLDGVDVARGDMARLQQELLDAGARIRALAAERDERSARAEQAATTRPAGGAGAGQENR
jgi:hypothetical protein